MGSVAACPCLHTPTPFAAPTPPLLDTDFHGNTLTGLALDVFNSGPIPSVRGRSCDCRRGADVVSGGPFVALDNTTDNALQFRGNETAWQQSYQELVFFGDMSVFAGNGP